MDAAMLKIHQISTRFLLGCARHGHERDIRMRLPGRPRSDGEIESKARKNAMNETTVRTYRGVLCRCCNQPIALPAIITRLEQQSGSELDESARSYGGRVFALRCGICEKEHPYAASAIVEIEGTPRPRLTRANGARALGKRLAGKLVRSAHAS